MKTKFENVLLHIASYLFIILQTGQIEAVDKSLDVWACGCIYTSADFCIPVAEMWKREKTTTVVAQRCTDPSSCTY